MAVDPQLLDILACPDTHHTALTVEALRHRWLTLAITAAIAHVSGVSSGPTR